MDSTKHTFVICAYKDSPYLTDCIDSIKNQSVKSSIICTTSTPGPYISEICVKHDIPLYINPEQGGIASDWNFAYNQANTPLITLAHQDDIYNPDFLKRTLEYLNKVKKPLIAFTDYYEIRGGKEIQSNLLLRIKRFMCTPWRIRVLQASRFTGRRIFMFGSPVCCPSVTYVRENLPAEPLFNTEYKNNCDWFAWVKIRDLPGEFVYCPKRLVGHRIHSESETTNRIADESRSKEDLQILSMLSPKPIAKLIHRFYVKSQGSNRIIKDI
jgi:glycosyltransferase involved in cell wall biosynthesis